MAAVADALEVGFGEIAEFAVEAVEVETRRELPREKPDREQQRGGDGADEQGETQAEGIQNGDISIFELRRLSI